VERGLLTICYALADQELKVLFVDGYGRGHVVEELGGFWNGLKSFCECAVEDMEGQAKQVKLKPREWMYLMASSEARRARLHVSEGYTRSRVSYVTQDHEVFHNVMSRGLLQ